MKEKLKHSFDVSKRILHEAETFSFENSRRIMEHLRELKKDADQFALDHIYDGWPNTKKLIELTNGVLIKTAEQTGMSLYDLCLTTKPVYEYDVEWDEEKGCANNVTTVTLKHIDFELVKGPGYWKGKYYKLKEEMQKLIDNG